MIKAIAFDLARVLINIKDIELTPLEKSLSDAFDYKVGDKLFWNWAEEFTGFKKDKLEKICWDIINKLYELREPDIFSKIPALKFATASNHLSMIKDWLKKEGVYDKFYCHVISEDIHFQKPSQEFNQILIKSLGEKAGDILFIDDKEENIEGAEKVGLKTLFYDGQTPLSESILKVIL